MSDTALFHTNDAKVDWVAKDPQFDEPTKELFALLVHRTDGVRVQTVEQFCKLMRAGVVRVHGFPPAPIILFEMAQGIGPRKKIRVQEFFKLMMDAMGRWPEPV